MASRPSARTTDTAVDNHRRASYRKRRQPRARRCARLSPSSRISRRRLSSARSLPTARLPTTRLPTARPRRPWVPAHGSCGPRTLRPTRVPCGAARLPCTRSRLSSSPLPSSCSSIRTWAASRVRWRQKAQQEAQESPQAQPVCIRLRHGQGRKLVWLLQLVLELNVSPPHHLRLACFVTRYPPVSPVSFHCAHLFRCFLAPCSVRHVYSWTVWTSAATRHVMKLVLSLVVASRSCTLLRLM
mmetsp:Transcript_317/g.656  ORF Transcript_317/g.656 Transcript_317/m.656 type:complete len:242 (+) Transcript_317:346-1071(+)